MKMIMMIGGDDSEDRMNDSEDIMKMKRVGYEDGI